MSASNANILSYQSSPSAIPTRQRCAALLSGIYGIIWLLLMLTTSRQLAKFVIPSGSPVLLVMFIRSGMAMLLLVPPLVLIAGALKLLHGSRGAAIICLVLVILLAVWMVMPLIMAILSGRASIRFETITLDAITLMGIMILAIAVITPIIAAIFLALCLKRTASLVFPTVPLRLSRYLYVATLTAIELAFLDIFFLLIVPISRYSFSGFKTSLSVPTEILLSISDMYIHDALWELAVPLSFLFSLIALISFRAKTRNDERRYTRVAIAILTIVLLAQIFFLGIPLFLP